MRVLVRREQDGHGTFSVTNVALHEYSGESAFVFQRWKSPALDRRYRLVLDSFGTGATKQPGKELWQESGYASMSSGHCGV